MPVTNSSSSLTISPLSCAIAYPLSAGAAIARIAWRAQPDTPLPMPAAARTPRRSPAAAPGAARPDAWLPGPASCLRLPSSWPLPRPPCRPWPFPSPPGRRAWPVPWPASRAACARPSAPVSSARLLARLACSRIIASMRFCSTACCCASTSACFAARALAPAAARLRSRAARQRRRCCSAAHAAAPRSASARRPSPRARSRRAFCPHSCHEPAPAQAPHRPATATAGVNAGGSGGFACFSVTGGMNVSGVRGSVLVTPGESGWRISGVIITTSSVCSLLATLLRKR